MTKKKKLEYLTKFNEKEFFENFKEFKGYLVNRKKYPKLNPDKLINLLNTYFRSLLLHPSPDTRKFVMQGPDGKFYMLEISGHNKSGEAKSVSLAEMSNTFIADMCSDLLKSARIVHLIDLIWLFTRALETPSLDKSHKFNIINAENTILKEKLSNAIRVMTEKNAKEAINVRKSFVSKELQALNSSEDKTNVENEKDREVLKNILIKYIRCNIDLLIANNKFIEIFKFIYEELEKYDDKHLVTSLLNYLVEYNNLFLLERKESIKEKIEQYRNNIGEKKYTLLDGMLNFSPDKIDLKDFSIELAGSDKDYIKFENIDYGKIKTIISFVIHCKSEKDYINFPYSEKCTIEFIRLRNLFDDPIFVFLNSLNRNMNGMPITIFSDAIGNIGNSTIVRITLKEFFHPDFDLIEDRISYIDFDEKEAKLGRKYYPHKDRIVEILRELHTDHSEKIPFDIQIKDININMISNHLVNYVDENNKSIFHKVHTITNLDSYLFVKKRYLEKISELNLSDEFLNIRDLLFDTHIVTPNSLKEFVNRALDLTVKKSIELRSIYKYLWKDDKFSVPLNEPDIQPIIKSHIQPTLEAKGIQISREVVAANGSLDFLCTYTHEGSLFKVGTELKKAHHNKLLNGLTQQLPQYLKDEGTKHGIFLALWFKNENFQQPARYEGIPDLIKELEKNIPKKYNFTIMVIDCTKGLSPSKM